MPATLDQQREVVRRRREAYWNSSWKMGPVYKRRLDDAEHVLRQMEREAGA